VALQYSLIGGGVEGLGLVDSLGFRDIKSKSLVTSLSPPNPSLVISKLSFSPSFYSSFLKLFLGYSLNSSYSLSYYSSKSSSSSSLLGIKPGWT
jgi:hypothetical protein